MRTLLRYTGRREKALVFLSIFLVIVQVALEVKIPSLMKQMSRASIWLLKTWIYQYVHTTV